MSEYKKQTKYMTGSDTEAALRRKGSTVAQRKAGRIESSVRTGEERRRRLEERDEDFDDRFENSGLFDEPVRKPKKQSAKSSGKGASEGRNAGRSTGTGNSRAGAAGTRPAGTRATGTRAAGTGASDRSAMQRTSAQKNAGQRMTAGRPDSARRVTGGSSERPGSGRAGRVGTRSAADYREYEEASENEETSLADDITIIAVLAVCILMVLSYFGLCGKLGIGINVAVFGLFGRLGYVLPFLIFFMTVFFIANKGKNTVNAGKVIYAFLFLCMLSGLIQMAAGGYNEVLKPADYFTNSRIDIEQIWPTYGGVLGGTLIYALCPLLGNVGTVVLLVALSLILFVLITGKAFITYMTKKVNKKAHEIRNNRRIERREREIYGGENGYYDDYGEENETSAGRNKTVRTNTARRRMGTFEVHDNPDTGLNRPEPQPSEGYGEPSRREAEDEQKKQDKLSKFWKRPRPVSDFDSAGKKDATAPADKPAVGGEEEKLHSVEPDKKALEEKGKDSGFADSELESRFANKPQIDLISLRNNPNPIQKNTTRQYFVTDDDSNIVKMPVSKSLHAGSSNTEDTGNGIGYKIHGLYPDDKEENLTGMESSSEALEKNKFSGAGPETVDFPEESGSEPEEDVTPITTIGLMKDKNIRDAEISNITSLRENVTPEDGPGQEKDDENGYEDDNAGSGNIRKITPISSVRNTDKKNPEKPVAEPKAVRDSSGAVRFTDVNAVPKEPEAPPQPEYIFPPVSLLKKSRGETRDVAAKKQELEQTIEKLQHTFESFNVGVTVTEASVGPTVTRYEVLPDDGVKVKTITSLSDDIKLALAAPEIRIEAPIPGKAAVGIEVPNKESAPVLFGDMIDSEEFRNSKSKLSFAVGKDISGETVVSNIGGMPHALIAGATGSGKSVCINALIMSILYKAKPTEVKMIMIDPKRVELVGYNGIPHLLVPVVTDVKKATGALNWAIAEMDNRYKLFADNAVTNLASYNELMEKNFAEEGGKGECPDKLPQVLIIVDELNDLMMTANSKEVEAAICRLTQLARACGIHVILATQRPSVNVITGTIKANIPTRIAFSVSSLVDSRTIIDQSGAEKLLGKGDMLFYPQGYAKPVRLQGAYVSDGEVAQVVKFIKDQYKEYKYNDDVSRHIETSSEPNGAAAQNEAGSGQGSDGRDEYFLEAGRFIIEKQKSSIGMLQRVYKIGFNRAARIMDQLAEEGVVGPEEGTKARKILMTLDEFNEKYGE